ncbi:MAG: nitroreductase family protein [Cyanobium sp. M30B3]|nr:MAG: nitroreductase family protein [Cyanobium sp. M30B3]
MPNVSDVDTLQRIIEKRRSSRSFQGNSTISNNDLIDLVRSGIYAPSGSNAQNQRFLILSDPNELLALGSVRWIWPYKSSRSQSQLRKALPAGLIGKCSAAIVVFADASLTDRRCNGEYPIWESLEVSNSSASIQNMLLLATAKGIASCWLSFNYKMSNTRLMSNQSICKAFPNYQIPPWLKPQGIIILGNPNRVDVDGYPFGEDYHGTTHRPVRREATDHYLIKRKSPNSRRTRRISPVTRARQATLSFAVRTLGKLTIYFSSKLERLELRLIDQHFDHP